MLLQERVVVDAPLSLNIFKGTQQFCQVPKTIIGTVVLGVGKNRKKIKKVLAIYISLLYNNPCCDIDSVEAEVAAHGAGHFVERMSIKNNWRQVTVLIPSVVGFEARRTEMTCGICPKT